MTLAQLLHAAQVPISVPEEIGKLKVRESPTVCPMSFYPWLRSDMGRANIDSLIDDYPHWITRFSEAKGILADRKNNVYYLAIERER